MKFNIPGISPGIIIIGTQIEIEFTKKPNCAKSQGCLIVSP